MSITRRSLFRSLVSQLAVIAPATAETPLQTFYITGLYHSKKFNDCTVPPIKVQAKDRVDALLRIPHVTVWTEAEFPAEDRTFPPPWCPKL